MAHPLTQSPAPEKIRVGAVYRCAKTIRLFDAPRSLALWHLASLDAPTVAVVWSLAFAWAIHVHPSGRVLMVLALAAWCAYVGDRLLDSRVLGSQTLGAQSLRPRPNDGRVSRARTGTHESIWPALQDRHYFHRRNRRLFVPLVALAACIAGFVALTLLPSFVREHGSILAAAALAYFSGVHAAPWLKRRRHSLPRLVSKEFLVAVLFTAGCILPAWSRLSGSPEFSHSWFWIAGIYFTALAWLNCSCIATWEAKTSTREAGVRRRRNGTFRFFSSLSSKFSSGVLLASGGLLLACLASGSHLRASALLAAGSVSALLLATLDSFRARMTPLALRAAADLVLLTPIALLLQ